MAELDDLDGVLDAVKEPLGEPPQLVVGEVHGHQGEVTGGEQLGP